MKPKNIVFLALLCLVFSAFGQNDQKDFTIQLNSRVFEPAPNFESFIQDPGITPDQVFDGKHYKIVQFKDLPSSEQRQTISGLGVDFLDYLPNYSYILGIPEHFDFQLLAEYNIRSVSELKPFDKMNYYLREKNYPEWSLHGLEELNLNVVCHKNVDVEMAYSDLVSRGVTISNIIYGNKTLTIRININRVNEIAALPYLVFLETVAPPPVPEDRDGRSLHRANALDADYGAGRNYNGTGVSIAINDDGFVGPHVDFKGRTDQTDVAGDLAGDHGDMVAGIAGGAGNVDPTIKGMATHAFLWIRQYVSSLPNTETLHQTQNVMLFSSSYSNGCNAGYTSTTQLVDMEIKNNPSLIQTFSAGNSNNSDCGYGAGNQWGNITGGHKIAKNVIATANLSDDGILQSSSSRGPASDGRIKPDISAHGASQLSTDPNHSYAPGGGTSAAAPGIAGVMAQLYQAYRDLNGGANPESPLLKAVLLNGADEKGNPGPDFKYGFGRVNGLRAVQMLENNQYLSSTIDNGSTNTHTITVPAGTRQLRAMLYWLDPEGSTIAAKALVNDLNFQVTDPNTTTFNPWVLDETPNAITLDLPAVRSVDDLNNVEQVTIDNPTAGNYTLTVNGFTVPQGPQKYYIVYEFISNDIIVTYPLGGEAMTAGDLQKIRWNAIGNSGTFAVEYSTNNGSTWNVIAASVSGSLRTLDWTVPSINTAGGLVRISRPGNTTGQSVAPFHIYPIPQNLSVGSVCPNETNLTWDPVTGAVSYDVYKLGATHMEIVGSTALTSYEVTGTNPNNEDWFSVRAIGPNGETGRRAYAVQKLPGVSNCPVNNDASISMILSPGEGTLFDCYDLTSLPVTVEVSNPGLLSQSNIPVFYQLNAGTPVSQVVSGPLAPGASTTLTFAGTVDLSGGSNFTLTAWTALSNDSASYNDTMTVNVAIITGSLTTVPFMEDFESSSLCGTAADCELTVCPLSNGMVNETNGQSDDIDWRVDEGGTTSSSTGPSQDVNPGTATGNYVYLEASSGCEGKLAHLVTPCISLAGTINPNLIYNYHMFGADQGSLSVDIYNGVAWTMNVVPTVNGDQGDQWNQVTVPLLAYVGQTINVRFRGTTGNGFTSDLALDDIQVIDLNAPPVADFTSDEQNICLGGDVAFTDLSTGFVNTWSWVITPSTYSFINGTSANSQNPEVAFTANGSYTVSLTTTNAISSDTETKTGYIVVGNGASLPVTEDFESFGACAETSNCGVEFCPLGNGWINNTNGLEDDIDWRVDAGGTPSVSTGPTVDKNPGTSIGQYIYVETSGSCAGQTAELVSPCIDLSGVNNPGVEFWYHMYGATMGSLHVDVFANGIWNLDAIAPISGDQGNDWKLGVVDLSAYSGTSVNVRFRGITGTSYTSDIALDDIRILNLSSAPSAEFTSDKQVVCSGDEVAFQNLSTGVIDLYTWSFSPATVTYVNGTNSGSMNPEVQFNTLGLYSVTLTVSNSFGFTSNTKTDFIDVTNGASIPFAEDFEAGNFPPTGWMIENPDGLSTWVEDSNAIGAAGVQTSSATLNNYSYNAAGQEDGMVTTIIDLSNANNPELTFDVAYAYYSETLWDRLRIDLSTDCGETYSPSGYDKAKDTLATVGLLTSSFTPSLGTDWRRDTVDLSDYTGGSIVLKFVNVNGYGNNIYIDNINVGEATAAPMCTIPEGVNTSFNSFNSVSLNWSAVPNATQYEIQGKPIGSSVFVKLTVPGTATSFPVNNLVSNLSYHWQIRAICDNGLTSAYSEFDTFNIANEFPCDLPVLNFTTDLTSSSVTLNWSTVPGALQYWIQGGVMGSASLVNLYVSAPTTSFPVANLPSNTTFIWRVATICGPGGSITSDFTTINAFTTLPGAAQKRTSDAVQDQFRATIYPNPFSGKAILDFTNTGQKPYDLIITDSKGQVVRTVSRITTNRVEIERKNLTSGVYYYRLVGDHIYQDKFIIQQ